jgi:hypothetical protein
VLNAKLGSYGTWSKMAREPLIWLGEADPVESMDQGWDEVLAAARVAGRVGSPSTISFIQ